MAYALPGVREALSVAIVIRSVDKFSRTFGFAAQGVGNLRHKYGALIGTISTLFDPMTILLAGIMAVTAACIKATQAAADFEYKMVEIRKVYQGSADDIDNTLIPAIKEIGATYGLTADEVAGAMTRWAQQGRKGVELQQLTEQAIRLTMVTMIDETRATEYLTAAINQFGLTVEDTNHIIAVWNHLGNTQMVTAAYLAEALVDCGASAAAYGTTLDEASTYLTLLSRAGFQAGEAGRGLRMIFERAFSDKSMKQLASVGISIYDANMEFRDMDDVLAELAGKWDSLTDIQRKNIAEAIAGRRHITKFNIIMKDFTDTTDMLASETEMLDDVQAEVNRTLDTAQKQWDITKSKIHNLTLKIGDYFLPISKEVAVSIGEWIDSIDTALPKFDDMKKAFKSVIDKIAEYCVALVGEDGEGGATGALYKWLEASGYVPETAGDEKEAVNDAAEAWRNYELFAGSAYVISKNMGWAQKALQGKMKYWIPILAEIAGSFAEIVDLLGLTNLLLGKQKKEVDSARKGYLLWMEILSPLTLLLKITNLNLQFMVKMLKEIKKFVGSLYEALSLVDRLEEKYGWEGERKKRETWYGEEIDIPLANLWRGLAGNLQTGAIIARPGVYRLGEDPNIPERVSSVSGHTFGDFHFHFHGGTPSDPKKFADDVIREIKYKLRGRGVGL